MQNKVIHKSRLIQVIIYGSRLNQKLRSRAREKMLEMRITDHE